MVKWRSVIVPYVRLIGGPRALFYTSQRFCFCCCFVLFCCLFVCCCCCVLSASRKGGGEFFNLSYFWNMNCLRVCTFCALVSLHIVLILHHSELQFTGWFFPPPPPTTPPPLLWTLRPCFFVAVGFILIFLKNWTWDIASEHWTVYKDKVNLYCVHVLYLSSVCACFGHRLHRKLVYEFIKCDKYVIHTKFIWLH